VSDRGSGADSIRVLLIAELCNPDWVSVSLEGWSLGRAVARRTNSHLVTHVGNRENILKTGMTEGLDFTAVESPTALSVVRRLMGVRLTQRTSSTTLTAMAALLYYLFERKVWQQFGGAIRGRAYDVVHRLTPLSPAIPSLLAKRCRDAGVPFVLGPVNGGLEWPREFSYLRIKQREWLSYVRSAYKLLPYYRATRNCASAIIVGSRATRIEVPERYRGKTVYIPENGIDTSRFRRARERTVELPLRIVFVGRLVPYKGADLLLEAAAPLARQGHVRVDIIGDGEEMAALRALVARERVGGAVRFNGWVAHRDLQKRLLEFHVLAFPSVREFGGAVVLEAMALGLVPIVMDYGGPGELVSATTGFALPMAGRQEIIVTLRHLLEQLAVNPSSIPAMGLRARARARRSFTWDAKAAQVLEVYRWVLRRRERPDFGMPLPDLGEDCHPSWSRSPLSESRSSGRQSRRVLEPTPVR
jgi:alpha-maltose-1-phosphate synthase